MSDNKEKTQRFDLRYISVDNNNLIWFVVCQMGKNILFNYDLNSRQMNFVKCIADYVDSRYPYMYLVLMNTGNKIIMAPYQSPERFFLEYNILSGVIERKKVPDEYYCSPACTDNLIEFSEVAKYNESIYFFSYKRKAFVEYRGADGKYYCHSELQDIIPGSKWGIDRYSMVQDGERLFLPIRGTNIIVEYDVINHISQIYEIPYDFKIGVMVEFGPRFAISSVESYDVVLWDKQSKSFEIIYSGDIFPKGTMPRLLIYNNILTFVPWSSAGVWCYLDDDNKIKKYSKQRNGSLYDIVYKKKNFDVTICYKWPDSVLEVYSSASDGIRRYHLYCDDVKYINILQEAMGQQICVEGFISLDLFVEKVDNFGSVYCERNSID